MLADKPPNEESAMAIAVYLHPASMSAAKYDEILQLLDDAGAGKH